ncbi:MAG: DotU family type IV/VI secretion system protein [Alphaproteobacteria bacterium]|jgi:type VI secretion system protein ImpK|nr:DotU family type IV/VI secretion system protein [Alphaproteobacteria bacterium]
MSRVKIASQSFLVHNFHEFFNLLLRQKELALRANEGNDPFKLSQIPQQLEETPPDTKEPVDPIKLAEEMLTKQLLNPEEPLPEEPAPEKAKPVEPSILQKKQQEESDNLLVNTIQRRLSLILEDQAIQSTIQAGEFAASSYQDSLYAMVAFADEIFLNIPWAGQKHWENNLLESRFFQTQIAGELIFEKIEELVSNNDPMRADLAIVYLLILGLGFKGRYRGEEANVEQLSLYRHQLYRMVNRHPSTLYDPGRAHLMEDCYEHVLDSTISRGLPEIRMWFLTFLGILGVYLFASTVLWYKLVRDMDSSIGNILNQAQQMGLS